MQKKLMPSSGRHQFIKVIAGKALKGEIMGKKKHTSLYA